MLVGGPLDEVLSLVVHRVDCGPEWLRLCSD